MLSRKTLTAFALAVGVAAPTAGFGQQESTSERLVDDIVRDIIYRTSEAAREEVRRQTGIDPLERGYSYRGDYPDEHHSRHDIRDETRRELRQLDDEYDRKMVKLEDELHRELNKAEREFRREAAKEEKPEKIREKREKLREKVDKAHDKFGRKVRKENRRFDEEREKILSKRYE
ncbi:hypothetical protein MD273_01650 [Marinobacter pelagius]|uniref:hypothetical protein n=1 Tax=Marinobacter sp. C7 TaxID=2951363 RepID=UPI001EEFDE17|nr:hypothetical protein [Marinobacter sp. C7]MCG7198421.1 hypothetical protein [Marinobacter sp. C7]